MINIIISTIVIIIIIIIIIIVVILSIIIITVIIIVNYIVVLTDGRHYRLRAWMLCYQSALDHGRHEVAGMDALF